jgi:hypothetical protein
MSSGYGSEQGRLADEESIAGARISAAELLGIHAERIYEILQEGDEAQAADLSMHLSIAEIALAAISDPPARLAMTCPRDGTAVIYDFALGKYCCARRHCPP